ncbi:serine/threonine-protein kinase [Pendulispora albinea]|uniref:Serine/threonine protein kinase n=1 Tax=Pendulispora albinea TaxID=2741071 RepID=A0ABZ2MA62_9BACT
MHASVQIGDVLASKYRIESILGTGAMGVVVSARHVQLGSRVALKFMLPEVLAVRGAAARFLREARAAARLRGEHIVRVSDVGTLETGAPYIVMEFLEGSDLDAVLRARGPLPVREALGYVLDACEALDEAHRAGIVHRDIKPKNLFLTRRPNGTALIKVLDFGISKLTDAAEDFHATATRTGAVLGSPAFMAPEQIRSAKHVDARADIYALGSLVYYLVSKTFPFDAETIGELFGKVLYLEPMPLRARRPNVPASLEAIVSRCLQKDPLARFPDVRELMSALRSVLDAMPPARNESLAARELHIEARFQQRARAADPVSHATAQSTFRHAAISSARALNPKRARPALLTGLSFVVAFVLLVAGDVSAVRLRLTYRGL